MRFFALRYFASPYSFVELEASFKREMHARIAWTLPRLSNVAALAQQRAAALAPAERLARDESAACAGRRHVLVAASFWDAGHSSHRITAPLVRALGERVCTYLLLAARLRPGRGGVEADGDNASAVAATDADADTGADAARRAAEQLRALQTSGFGFRQVVSHSVRDDDVAGALALHLAASTARFDAVLFPSVGMSGADILLASMRSAPLQIVLYGHSSSTRSGAADVFVGGLAPEVLGPLASDLHAPATDCAAAARALERLAHIALEAGAGVADAGTSAGAGAGTGEGSAGVERMPLVALCGDAAPAASAAPCTPRSAAVAMSGAAARASVAELLGGACRSTFAAGERFGPALARRLADAQSRYSERLLLVPGLGLWFSGTFPQVARGEGLARPPPRGATLAQLVAAARDFSRLAGLLEDGGGGDGGDGGDGDGDGVGDGGGDGIGGGSDNHAAALGAVEWRGVGVRVRAAADAVNASGSAANDDVDDDEGATSAWRTDAGGDYAGDGPAAPLRAALVWSLVKWNSAHLERTLRAVEAAQRAWARARRACVADAAAAAATSGAGAGAGAELPSSPLPAAARLPAPQRALCESLLRASGGMRAPQQQQQPPPPLRFELVALVSMDALDPLRELAVGAALRRLIEPRFADGSVRLRLVTDASTPRGYLARLAACDAALDAQPFAACNTMQDLLTLAVPAASLAHDGAFEGGEGWATAQGPWDGDGGEGGGRGGRAEPEQRGRGLGAEAEAAPGPRTPLRWRSGIGAALLTRAGLSGLVALSARELRAKSAALLANPFLRAAWRARMAAAEWRAALEMDDEAARDAGAVAALVESAAKANEGPPGAYAAE